MAKLRRMCFSAPKSVTKSYISHPLGPCLFVVGIKSVIYDATYSVLVTSTKMCVKCKLYFAIIYKVKKKVGNAFVQ